MNGSQEKRDRLSPLVIVVLYALSGVMWILFSDSIVLWFVKDADLLTRVQTFKGWFYVLVTAVLLYVLIRGMANRLERSRLARQEEERSARRLMAQLPLGLALCRMDGSLVEVNPAYGAIIGRTVDETLGLSYWDITPKKYADQEARQLESLHASGRYGPYEKEYIHKAGHLVPVRLQGLLVERGGEQFIWSSAEDISERKRMDEALRLSEEKFAAAFRSSPDAIALTDASTGQFIEVNDSFLSLSGYTREEISGRTTVELGMWVEPLERDRFLGLLRQQGKVLAMEADFYRKGGSVANCLISGESVELQKQHYFLSVLLDITDRKHAEEALRESEERFRGLFEQAAVGFAQVGLDGKWLAVNQRLCDIVGYPRGELLGLTFQDITHPDDLDADLDNVRQLLAGSIATYSMEKRYVRKDGSLVWIELTVSLLRESSGDPKYFISVIQDIETRKFMEEELRRLNQELEVRVAERTREFEMRGEDLRRSQLALVNIVEDLNDKTRELGLANERLQELDRLKSMFIASMSHELRTPLNSIIGFSGVMLQGMGGEITDDQREHLGRIFRAGKHLLSLITDVIDIAKIESGKITPHAEEFELKGLLDEAVGQVRRQAEEKGLEIVMRLPEGRVTLRTDRKRLLQCLLNYLSNAVKFSEQGTVTVVAKGQTETGTTDRETVAGSVEISVSDTGIGIKEEDLPRLFGSFVRLETPLMTAVPGTGLGLYLTKKLAVEVLGGEVGVESEEGRGSRFWLRVPMDLGQEG